MASGLWETERPSVSVSISISVSASNSLSLRLGAEARLLRRRWSTKVMGVTEDKPEVL